ncbi:MAG: Na(+)-translocating NADH-quinone reductase subunit C [Acidobacteriota bacterium]
MPRSNLYTLGFAAAMCLACSILVTSSAVSLRPAQQVNQLLDKQKNVLESAGLLEPGESVTPEEVETLFESFRPVVVDLQSDALDSATDAADVDMRKWSKDPGLSTQVEKNLAQVRRVPHKAVIYELLADNGSVELVVMPVEGAGLWGTMYGFLAVSGDLQEVRGLTFYEHKETPGLGGEVDNPRWKALWPGRKIYGGDGDIAIEVIKGIAGSVEDDPYRVDGMSGATITSRGVTNMLRFWLGEEGYGPYLDSYLATRQQEAA